MVVSACNAWCPSWDSIHRFQHWYHERRLPSTQQTLFRPNPHLTPVEKFTDLMLFSLCDLQLTTGTAIIVAGLAQFPGSTFYHRQLIITYWFLTLNSFWAARASSCRTIQDRTPSNWDSLRGKIRNVVIIITLALAAAFDIKQVLGKKREWDPFASGKCYRVHDMSALDAQWLWIAGMGLYAVTLCVQMTARGQERVDYLAGLLKNGCKKLGMHLVSQVEETSGLVKLLGPSTRMPYLTTVCALVPRSLWSAFLAIAFGLTWSLSQFLGVWSAGQGFQAVEVVVYTALNAWNTWNIIDLKVSNKKLLTDSESSWGFGQLLPLFLLLMLGLNFFDAAKETWEKGTK